MENLMRLPLTTASSNVISAIARLTLVPDWDI